MGNLLVYNASAGSGKTYNLALQYIKLAIEADSPTAYRNILAVTFTNKATAEMKDRILLHLFNLAHGGLNKKFLNDLLKLLNPEDNKDEQRHVYTALEVFSRSASLLQHILHDYDHFRVETIDSFFQSLLTNLAHELELTRNFRIDLDDEDVISRAVDRLMMELTNSQSELRKKGVLRLLYDYMGESIEDEKGWNVAKSLKKFAADNLFDETYLKYEDQLNAALNDSASYAELKNFEKEHAATYIQRMEKEAHAIEDLIEASAHVSKFFHLDYTQKLVGKILSGTYDAPISNTLGQQMEEPQCLLKKDYKEDSDALADAELIAERLRNLRDTINDYTHAVFTARITTAHVGIMRLLSEIGNMANEINKETGHFMLAKTPELFNRMIQKTDAPFVFERVGTTFNHIMIDEFQDTSRMQWSNFHKLLVENLAQGNQCMLVGDIKQSIYRWRDGDWKILEEVVDDDAFHSKKPIPLTQNWRSLKEIIAFNNKLFPAAAKALDEVVSADNTLPNDWNERIQTIYKDVDQTACQDADGGWIRMSFSEKKCNDADIIDDLHAQMLRLHNEARIPYSDMLILVRWNREGTDIINHLAAIDPDFPINSTEAFSLTSSPAVMVLVNALRYLVADINDRASKLQLLQSIQLLLPDESLKECDKTDLLSLLSQAETLLPSEILNPDERCRMADMPLYELCHKLITLFHLAESSNPEATAPDRDVSNQSAYLFTFLDGVLQFLDDNASDIPTFLSHWDASMHKQSTSGESGDSVMVMTIHKAKGLARHTILIPFCDWDIVKDRPDDVLWCRTPDYPPFNALPITAIKTLDKNISKSYYHEDKEFEHLQQRVDNLNMLYVAFTRPKSNMLVWARTDQLIANVEETKDKGKKKNSDLKITTIGDLLARTAPKFLTLCPEPVLEDAGTNEPVPCQDAADESETEEPTFTVFERGQLKVEPTAEEKAKEKKKKREEEQKNPISNPLDEPHIEPIPIKLTADESAKVDFRQSNPAKDFIASAETGALTAEEDGESENPRQQSYIDRGKLMHRIFSQIRQAADLDTALHDCEVEGLLGGAKEKNQIHTFIAKRLQNEAVRPWFDGSWQIFNECSILFREANGELCTRRPDRVMVKDGQAVVVDFKFGRPDEQYHTQVQSYMQFLQHMGYASVRGYLWFVYSGRVEEVTLL